MYFLGHKIIKFFIYVKKHKTNKTNIDKYKQVLLDIVEVQK